MTALGGSQLFAPERGAGGGMAGLAFGQTNGNHRYKMPLLPGERGTKSLPKGAAPWVPYGMQSATNLAGSISETRALGIWERERTQIGLALRPDLVQRLTIVVRKLLLNGFDFTSQRLRDTEEGQAVQLELGLIHEEAKQTAGGNAAASMGTNHHDVWETRAETGQWVGTPEMNATLEAVEELLRQSGLERVPNLSERVIRNTDLNCAGKFDDVLRCTRGIAFTVKFGDGRLVTLPEGTLLMADLKTKRRPFWGWLEPRIQLAVYAGADWMLDGDDYIPGPKHHVNQQWGVLLHAPMDGAPPKLKRVNLSLGREYAVLARMVCDARAESKNVLAHAEAEW